MSKGIRIFLHVLQGLALAAALLFMVFTFLMTYADFGATTMESHFVGSWVIGFGILSIAFSPALWSRRREQASAPPASGASGSYDRVSPPPPGAPHQARPGPHPGAFESPGPDAPAAPGSAYGQPAPGAVGFPAPSSPNSAFGSPPQGTPPSPPTQSDGSPWGGR